MQHWNTRCVIDESSTTNSSQQDSRILLWFSCHQNYLAHSVLLLEEEEVLDNEEFSSCSRLDELPKWLLFSSLIEAEDGEIWQ
jgi:hypothetical protein